MEPNPAPGSLPRSHGDRRPRQGPQARRQEAASPGRSSRRLRTAPGAGRDPSRETALRTLAAPPLPALRAGSRAALELARSFMTGDDEGLATLLAGHPAADRFAASLRILEPTALALGDLSSRDECSEFAATLALVRLQTDFRRLCVELPSPATHRPGRHVLVAPVPGETHGLGAAMASEALWRAGHDVDIDFPPSESALIDEVGATDLDAVHLALSPAVRRDERLSHLTGTVAALRRASPNTRLQVFVGGRVFDENRGAVRSVGADGGASSALELDGLVRTGCLPGRTAEAAE